MLQMKIIHCAVVIGTKLCRYVFGELSGTRVALKGTRTQFLTYWFPLMPHVMCHLFPNITRVTFACIFFLVEMHLKIVQVDWHPRKKGMIEFRYEMFLYWKYGWNPNMVELFTDKSIPFCTIFNINWWSALYRNFTFRCTSRLLRTESALNGTRISKLHKPAYKTILYVIKLC